MVRSAPDIDRFHPVPPEPELKRGKPHLLCYLGVMGPQDGVDYALRALAKLRDELGRTDWHAVFVGAGDTFDAMVELSRQLGLSEQVQFTGRIPDEDLVRYLSTADACLSPHPHNPLNDVSTMNKVLEYMVMGRPIVSFDLREAQSPPATPPSTRPPTTRPSSPSSSHCCWTIRRSGPGWARSARSGSAGRSPGGTPSDRCSPPTPPPAATTLRRRQATRTVHRAEAAPLNDDTIRLVTIGRIIRRRWRLLTILAVVGALVGYGTSLLFPPRCTTSASVLLPGAWEERELLTQQEVATSSVVVGTARPPRSAARGQRQRAAGSGERHGRQREHHQASWARPTPRNAHSNSPTRWPSSSSPSPRGSWTTTPTPKRRRSSRHCGRWWCRPTAASPTWPTRPIRADRGERAVPHRAREAAHHAAGGHQQAGRGRPGRRKRPTWSSWGRRPGRSARHRRRG